MTRTPALPAEAIARQADSDTQLVALWLHDRPASTRRAYQRDIDRFLGVVRKPLPVVTLGDLHAYADTLEGVAAATRARYLSAVKSLLAFGHRLGYLPVNVGVMVRLPALRNRLAERILLEADVQRLIALEPGRATARCSGSSTPAGCAGPNWSTSAGATWSPGTTPVR